MPTIASNSYLFMPLTVAGAFNLSQTSKNKNSQAAKDAATNAAQSALEQYRKAVRERDSEENFIVSTAHTQAREDALNDLDAEFDVGRGNKSNYEAKRAQIESSQPGDLDLTRYISDVQKQQLKNLSDQVTFKRLAIREVVAPILKRANFSEVEIASFVSLLISPDKI